MQLQAAEFTLILCETESLFQFFLLLHVSIYAIDISLVEGYLFLSG